MATTTLGQCARREALNLRFTDDVWQRFAILTQVATCTHDALEIATKAQRHKDYIFFLHVLLSWWQAGRTLFGDGSNLGYFT